MKTTIIDLLNKIANEEEPPKKIYYLEETFTYDEQSKDYYDSETYGLFDRYVIPPILNDEVEIIEDNKKIEKLKVFNNKHTKRLTKVERKINEIIDCINKE